MFIFEKQDTDIKLEKFLMFKQSFTGASVLSVTEFFRSGFNGRRAFFLYCAHLTEISLT